MSQDQCTETEVISWGSRLMDSIKGVLFGIVLFFASFPLLFWNEGRAVKTAEGISQGKSEVVSVAADKPDPSNEGKLVYFSGRAGTAETLKDQQFGVSMNALRLVRQVQMYQWAEKKETRAEKQLGGGERRIISYTYSKKWNDRLIDSDQFSQKEGHVNPTSMPVAGNSWQASVVSVGKFSLPANLVSKLPTNGKVASPTTLPASMPLSVASKANVCSDGYYIGNDPNNPEVGDIRIDFMVAFPMEVSVLGQQTQSTIQPYPAKTGTQLELIEAGLVGPETMLQHQETQNKFITWLLRVVGFLMMLLGVGLFFRPLVVVAGVVPFVGDILGLGAGLLAIAISLPLALITIAIAWLVYRPLVGAGLLLVAAILFILVKKAAKRRKAAKQA